jgi:pseudouridine-5'-phosphate glycosidase
MDEQFINGIIETALKEADERKIAGKDVTPFMLGKVKELTGGKSLEANIALVKNNAVVGAKIAVSLNGLK